MRESVTQSSFPGIFRGTSNKALSLLRLNRETVQKRVESFVLPVPLINAVHRFLINNDLRDLLLTHCINAFGTSPPRILRLYYKLLLLQSMIQGYSNNTLVNITRLKCSGTNINAIRYMRVRHEVPLVATTDSSYLR